MQVSRTVPYQQLIIQCQYVLSEELLTKEHAS